MRTTNFKTFAYLEQAGLEAVFRTGLQCSDIQCLYSVIGTTGDSGNKLKRIRKGLHATRGCTVDEEHAYGMGSKQMKR